MCSKLSNTVKKNSKRNTRKSLAFIFVLSSIFSSFISSCLILFFFVPRISLLPVSDFLLLLLSFDVSLLAAVSSYLLRRCLAVFSCLRLPVILFLRVYFFYFGSFLLFLCLLFTFVHACGGICYACCDRH